jgi:hypothetical protein
LYREGLIWAGWMLALRSGEVRDALS